MYSKWSTKFKNADSGGKCAVLLNMKKKGLHGGNPWITRMLCRSPFAHQILGFPLLPYLAVLSEVCILTIGGGITFRGSSWTLNPGSSLSTMTRFPISYRPSGRPTNTSRKATERGAFPRNTWRDSIVHANIC